MTQIKIKKIAMWRVQVHWIQITFIKIAAVNFYYRISSDESVELLCSCSFGLLLYENEIDFDSLDKLEMLI